MITITLKEGKNPFIDIQFRPEALRNTFLGQVAQKAADRMKAQIAAGTIDLPVEVPVEAPAEELVPVEGQASAEGASAEGQAPSKEPALAEGQAPAEETKATEEASETE